MCGLFEGLSENVLTGPFRLIDKVLEGTSSWSVPSKCWKVFKGFLTTIHWVHHSACCFWCSWILLTLDNLSSALCLLKLEKEGSFQLFDRHKERLHGFSGFLSPPRQKRVIGFYQTTFFLPRFALWQCKIRFSARFYRHLLVWGLVSLTVTFEPIAFQGGPFSSARCETHSSRVLKLAPPLIAFCPGSSTQGKVCNRCHPKGASAPLPSSLILWARIPTPDFCSFPPSIILCICVSCSNHAQVLST